MKTLSQRWFYENLPDFEYKKYLLLAYLQDVHQQFNQTRLYPALSDLVQHYRNLKAFKEQKQELFEAFPKYLSEIDLAHFKLKFNSVISNDELMQHLEEVIDFSIPAIQKHIEEGKEIYEFIEREIVFDPVGILPIYRNEGYLLIRGDEIRVYEYTVQLFSQEEEQYRSVSTCYLTSYKPDYVNTFENIKIDMIKQRRKLPNPATFGVSMRFEYPVEDTILPISKRLLMKYVL